jgi:hypothetical protein
MDSEAQTIELSGFSGKGGPTDASKRLIIGGSFYMVDH